ncbi:MAG: Z1 domain-containing protein [Bacteroidia bacterium]
MLKASSRIALDAISKALSYNLVNDADFELFYRTAITEFTTNNPIDIVASASLTKTRGDSWLTDAKYQEISWDYTDRYFQYLHKTGRAKRVIDETYRSSRRILEKLGDPNSNQEFYVKGLVVGSVQSGKTTNFNAVINRSIDAGYGLVIVLSGVMEDLRRQTQIRIENEVAGYGVVDEVADRKDFKGVGEIKRFGVLGDRNIHQVVLPTSYKVDFKTTIKKADFSLNNKNILICKKNTSVLKNLILWLEEYLNENKDKHKIPFLIIDDEADNASLNNMGAKGRDYASKINGHIRALLGLFSRKTYLGYTATPFASVLQDRNQVPTIKWPIEYKDNGVVIRKEFDLVDNIFPDDFIELLFPPSNYIGAKHFFETRIEEVKKIEPLIPPCPTDTEAAFPHRIVREGGKETATTKDDDFPKYLPDSLKEAIQCFILSTAIRLSRKQVMKDSKLFNPHNTMLIHISRFTLWQTRTKNLIEDYVNKTLLVKLSNDLPSDPKSIYAEFERTWYKYYAHVIENIKSYLPEDYEDDFLIPKAFERDIKPLLNEAARGIEIKAINSQTKDALIYPEKSEKKYIAIGGNKLSRGFTLEGLTINYFIRNTDFADTLLQMGRWFGYRPGYLDCCKLFTTADNVIKYDAITSTIEELEVIFLEMSKKNGKPSEFDVRVRSHPKVIQITRNSILQNTEEIKVNYSGDIEQSTKFDINKSRIENAWNAFVFNNTKIKWQTDERGFFVFKTDSTGLFNFLDLDNSFYNFDLPGVKEYISLCNRDGKLTNWTIAVKTNKTPKVKAVLSKNKSNLPGDMFLTIRRGPKESSESNSRSLLLDENIFKASGRSANIVATGEDFALTLTEIQKQKAIKEFVKRKAEEFETDGLEMEAALKKAKEINSIPDKEFRLQMDETDGILMIYLMDSKRIFEPEEGVTDEKLLNYAKERSLDFSIPLIGYALGFPKVSGDIGGLYVHYKEPIDIEEDEFDEELQQDEN